jgi:enamine deaminase RidA (YjgF/YER057c/UK114 family)
VKLESILPDGWEPGRGYAHAIATDEPAHRVLHVAGQFGVDHGDAESELASEFGRQWARALARVVEAVRAAGGDTELVATLHVYVTDLDAYRAAGKELGAGFRAAFGSYFPAITLVQVVGLVDPAALVEIEALAYVRQ